MPNLGGRFGGNVWRFYAALYEGNPTNLGLSSEAFALSGVGFSFSLGVDGVSLWLAGRAVEQREYVLEQ